MTAEGLATRLNPGEAPEQLPLPLDPSDVARVENRTYIASRTADAAGPTNNWIDPVELKATMSALYRGCMRGRTLYVIPFSMGPVGSPIAKIGVEITDSPYVVVNMHLMTRVGTRVLEVLGDDGEFIPCLHSVASRSPRGRRTGRLALRAARAEVHLALPGGADDLSYGSGYGGNALLGKKCWRCGSRRSWRGTRAGWPSTCSSRPHQPRRREEIHGRRLPLRLREDQPRHARPHPAGWKVETVGDDIAWMKFGADGRLYAINPEAGFFGVAPYTSNQSNPNAMRSIDRTPSSPTSR
jgi:phosphoenolpyruvate carboxykinase (GTP)